MFPELAGAAHYWIPLQRYRRNERIWTHYERVSASGRPAGLNSCLIYNFGVHSMLCIAAGWHFSSTFSASAQNEKVIILHDLQENPC